MTTSIGVVISRQEGFYSSAGTKRQNPQFERMEEAGLTRLLLFDIDGTLLWPGAVPKECMARAMEEVFGSRGEVAKYSFAGKTDLRIVTDIMTQAGYPASQVQSRMGDVLARYISLLNDSLRPEGMILYRGTRPLLESLRTKPGVILGLVTGNVETGARIKLGRFGLNESFETGAFGNDSIDRDDLPGIARRRAQEYYQLDIPAAQVVVIGDSVYDVRSARVAGARAVAVATGRTSRQALAAEHPDCLLDNIDCTEDTVAALLGAASGQ